MRVLPLLFAVLVAAPMPSAHAQVATSAQVSPPAAPEASPELKARLAALPDILNGRGDYDSYFAANFRAAVPKDKFAQMIQQLMGSVGPFVAIERVTIVSPWEATLDVGFRDAVGSGKIIVDKAEPHQVTGFGLSSLVARAASVDEVVKQIAALPGLTGFAFATLGDGAPRIDAARNADTPLAIGSAFKLTILAELVREVNAGERHWDDKETLDGTQLPGGAYVFYPKGAEVTIRELAGKMISISDNSATDILLRTLGREKVEAMMPVVGVADPARNRPFLSTLEMFKLKGIAGLDARWLATDEAGRRAMLAEVDAAPVTSIRTDLFRDGKPIHVDTIEWYYSPADLVRVMDWLRRNTASGPGAEARAILGKNPGIGPASAGRWQYVGYKGGSEPGVLNLTLLLQGKDGSWHVLTASWNDTTKDVELNRLLSLISRAADLSAPK
ncbi:serine hydrolase [Sphingomonas sp.]|uniref:serine hydrolase n=1 Tax=Sphingomonas sp. TaxID=28214 RepID=UPI001AFD3735|nr:serine hydrolase [Sphingomonas sp.]MBO9713665.1 serine hydrolase [Sphingomonas sp.]